MPALKFDLKELEKAFSEIEDEARTEIGNAISGLPIKVIDHARELAQKRLSQGRAQKFVSHLQIKKEVSKKKKQIVISLDPKFDWLDEGAPPFDLKTTLKGHSRVVNMKHPLDRRQKGGNKLSTQQAKFGQEIKAAMKTEGIRPMAAVKPGEAIRANIKNVPSHKSGTHSGESVLNRLQIKKNVGPGFSAKKGNVTEASTFRTMTKDQPADMWILPAIKPTNIMSDTQKWLDENIIRLIMESIGGGSGE